MCRDIDMKTSKFLLIVQGFLLTLVYGEWSSWRLQIGDICHQSCTKYFLKSRTCRMSVFDNQQCVGNASFIESARCTGVFCRKIMGIWGSWKLLHLTWCDSKCMRDMWLFRYCTHPYPEGVLYCLGYNVKQETQKCSDELCQMHQNPCTGENCTSVVAVDSFWSSWTMIIRGVCSRNCTVTSVFRRYCTMPAVTENRECVGDTIRLYVTPCSNQQCPSYDSYRDIKHFSEDEVTLAQAMSILGVVGVFLPIIIALAFRFNKRDIEKEETSVIEIPKMSSDEDNASHDNPTFEM